MFNFNVFSVYQWVCKALCILSIWVFPFTAFAGISATVNVSESASTVTIDATASSPDQCPGGIPAGQQIGWSTFSANPGFCDISGTGALNFPFPTYPTLESVAIAGFPQSPTYSIYPAGSGVSACNEIWTQGSFGTII